MGFIFGCRMTATKVDQARAVSQDSSVASVPDEGSSQPLNFNSNLINGRIHRIYQDSLSCKLLEIPNTSSYENETVKVSALSGFAVGPQSAAIASDLSKPILRPFTSDGCSSSPDGIPLTKKSDVWVDCCIRHDTAYWMGGTREEKKKADEDLSSCIADLGYPKLGTMYKGFVREFGGPNSIHSYRWGFGWNQKRKFSELSEEDINQIKYLYGVNKNQFPDFMMNQNFPLQRVCEYTDPVFNGFSKEEILVYEFLNAYLKKQDVITWARLGFYNQEHLTYQIKLQSCEEPVSVTIYGKSKKPTELKSTCGL